MDKASKVISEAIVGSDYIIVYVNNKAYAVQPPTIKRIAGAVSCLSRIELTEISTLKDIFLSTKDCESYAKALSWLVKGNLSLADEFSKGTFEEVVDALSSSFELVGINPFLKAASLMKTASLLTANQSPK